MRSLLCSSFEICLRCRFKYVYRSFQSVRTLRPPDDQDDLTASELVSIFRNSRSRSIDLCKSGMVSRVSKDNLTLSDFYRTQPLYRHALDCDIRKRHDGGV